MSVHRPSDAVVVLELGCDKFLNLKQSDKMKQTEDEMGELTVLLFQLWQRR